MKYSIKRICWCEKTFNGYTDNPYWEIELLGYGTYGLKDDGHLWSFNNTPISDFVRAQVNNIISECKLTITLS